MHSTLLALMAIQSIVHYASAEAESRRLQAKLYQAEELAEDTLESYFNLLELSMSISLTSGSPSSAPSLFQGSGKYCFIHHEHSANLKLEKSQKDYIILLQRVPHHHLALD